MLFLVQMRADLLAILRKNSALDAEVSALRSLDASLKVIDVPSSDSSLIYSLMTFYLACQSFLSSWFSVGFLKLERVTYEQSPGQLLEKIIRYEAVHPVGTIIELKRRLGTFILDIYFSLLLVDCRKQLIDFIWSGKGRRCFAFFHPRYVSNCFYCLVLVFKHLFGVM